VKPTDVWEGRLTKENAKPMYSAAQVLQILKDVHGSGAYKNCHCWVFNETQFTRLIQQAIRLDLLTTEIVETVKTAPGEQEFFVSLRRPLTHAPS
jgi:hypothetical protein